jgi:DNA polymerase
MQNLTKGSALRKAIVAPKGFKIVTTDLSQIEARMVAWLAGQEDLLNDFRNNVDVYSKFYNNTFNANITKANKEERFIGKVAVLSLMYASGAVKFHHTVNISGVTTIDSATAETVVSSYRTTYSKIKQLWYTLDKMLDNMIAGNTLLYRGLRFTCKQVGDGRYVPCVELYEGRVLYYPELYVDSNNEKWYRGTKGEWKKIYGGAFTENLSQALSQLIIRDAELRIAKRMWFEYFAVGQVHDELIYCVPEELVPSFVKIVNEEMCRPPVWAPDFPLACETEVGDNYAETK